LLYTIDQISVTRLPRLSCSSLTARSTRLNRYRITAPLSSFRSTISSRNRLLWKLLEWARVRDLSVSPNSKYSVLYCKLLSASSLLRLNAKVLFSSQLKLDFARWFRLATCPYHSQSRCQRYCNIFECLGWSRRKQGKRWNCQWLQREWIWKLPQRGELDCPVLRSRLYRFS